jgi:hypothetical protein
MGENRKNVLDAIKKLLSTKKNILDTKKNLLTARKNILPATKKLLVTGILYQQQKTASPQIFIKIICFLRFEVVDLHKIIINKMLPCRQ